MDVITTKKKRQKNRDFIFWILIFGMVFFDISSDISMQLGKIKTNNLFLIMGMITYTLSGIIFYRLLFYKDLLIVNTMWSLGSIIFVSLISSYYFKTKYKTTEKIGLFISIFSIYFLSQ